MKSFLLLALMIVILILSGLLVFTYSCSPQTSWKLCPRECTCHSSWFFKGFFVDCSCKRLSNIPQNVPKDTVEFVLAHNSITSIPHINLRRLKRLDMGYNQLKLSNINGLCERIHCDLTSLKLAGNQLMKFPSGLPKSLLYLDFSDNGIVSLSCSELNVLPPLESLNVASNFLTSIGRHSFCSNADQPPVSGSLRRLDLSRNNIFHLDDEAFCCLKHLEYLNLSSNSFTSLTSKQFQSLSSLQVLDLSSNSLIQVADGAFISLNKLEFLNLAKNRLTIAPRNVPSNIVLLDLSNNAIIMFNEDHSLLSVQRVLVAYNPLHCNCNLRWIRNHLVQSAKITLDKDLCPPKILEWLQFTCTNVQSLMPRCAKPLKYAGRVLDMLNENELECHEEPTCIQQECHSKRQSKEMPRVVPPAFRRYVRSAKLIDKYFHMNCPRVELPENRWISGRAISEYSILIEWNTPVGMEDYTFDIIYYRFGFRNCTVQDEVDASRGSLTIAKLYPNTNYIICLIPRHCPVAKIPILLELCLEITTQKLPLYKRIVRVLLGGYSCCYCYAGLVLIILLLASFYLMSGYLIRIVKNVIHNIHCK